MNVAIATLQVKFTKKLKNKIMLSKNTVKNVAIRKVVKPYIWIFQDPQVDIMFEEVMEGTETPEKVY